MATARERLDSIITRCAQLQNWKDSDLEFNLDLLVNADRELDSCVTIAESDDL